MAIELYDRYALKCRDKSDKHENDAKNAQYTHTHTQTNRPDDTRWL